MTSSWAFLTINVLFTRRGVGNTSGSGLVGFDFKRFSHPGRGTNSIGARAPHDRAVTYVNSREILMIPRLDTLGGSATMSMNFTLCGRSRKIILVTE